MKLYFDDVAFDGQLQRSVGKSDAGMANAGECLAIAQRIITADRNSWYQAWSDFASGLVSRGDEARRAGHNVSARNVYLRAAEYFRQAFFFHREDLDADKLRGAFTASVTAFRAALKLTEYPARPLTGEISGYLFCPAAAGSHPTILHVGGYDSTAEELYASVPAALDRGYAFAAVDGPGHGATLYDRRVAMRPDWESVVPKMFDALAAEREVDESRIVLVGRSFGGLIAPRGAAGEHRLAGLIVDPGQFDMGPYVRPRGGARGADRGFAIGGGDPRRYEDRESFRPPRHPVRRSHGTARNFRTSSPKPPGLRRPTRLTASAAPDRARA